MDTARQFTPSKESKDRIMATKVGGFLRKALWFFLVLPSFAIAQDWSLAVSGEIPAPVTLTPKEFGALPHVKVTAKAEKDTTASIYEGVPLYTVLQRCGVMFGDSLHGKRLFLYLQAEALDGYKVVYALPEIDTAFNENTIIVADAKNGTPLDAKAAPLQIVVPKEKKHSRWIRQLKALRILRGAD